MTKLTSNLEKRLYRKVDIAALLGISISTIDRWIKEGKLPKPRKGSDRFVCWTKEQIDNLELLA